MATAGSSLSATPSSLESLQSEEKIEEGRGSGGWWGLKCIRNESKAIEKAAGEVLRGDEGGTDGGEESGRGKKRKIKGDGDKSVNMASHITAYLVSR